MKVLQAIIISLFFIGCATDSEVLPSTSSSPMGGGDSPEKPANDAMGDGDSGDVCAEACQDGEPGAPGTPGMSGLDGSSCSVVQAGQNATVSCTDGTMATLEGTVGTIGPQGPMGVPGPMGPSGPQGATGPAGASVQGPQGPVGPQGSTGPAGQDGTIDGSSIYTVRAQVNAGGSYVTAYCEGEDVTLSGGCVLQTATVPLVTSAPNSSTLPGSPGGAVLSAPDGWGCRWASAVGTNGFAYTVCMAVD